MMRQLDIRPGTRLATKEKPELRAPQSFTASSRTRPLRRLADRSKESVEMHLYEVRQPNMARSFSADAFTLDEVSQPNMTDKATVLALANITADAYIAVEGTLDWLDVGNKYNLTDDYGWEAEGLRGHIFATPDNGTVVIDIKGTSTAIFDGGGGTAINDKINDNTLFSCCCARVGYWWTPVCDCYAGTAYTCNDTCVVDAIYGENMYYRAALQLYYNVTHIYPAANIWVVGHSLGGALSSLLGQTYGLPVVAFESPGEAFAAKRLGLPLFPGSARQSGDVGVYHVGNTGDPVYMGTCNGPTSVCSIGGFAFETLCHAGVECTYDVVTDRGWSQSINYHRIQNVVKDIIATYDDVPTCAYDECTGDCWNWKFTNGSEPITSTTSTTSSSSSTTSTTTCLTPGWWGCRDITTTTTTTPSTTSPTDTSTITTTTPASDPPSQTSTSSGTTTCTSYGWFGNCLDPSPVPPSTSSQPRQTNITTTPSIPSAVTHTPSATSCTSPGVLWGCWDENAPSSTAPPSSASASMRTTPAPTTRAPTHTSGPIDRGHWECVHRSLFGLGWCEEWRWRARWDWEL